MAHIGREHTSNIDKNEYLEERAEDLDGGYSVSFLDIQQDLDMEPMFTELPNGMCQCPHWGVMEAGEITFRYADGSQEVLTAGEAYYIRPGHIPRPSAGARTVMFSPTDLLKATNEAIERGLAKLGEGSTGG